MRYRILYIVIILTVFQSCSNRDSNEHRIKQRIGEGIYFPEDYSVINDTITIDLIDYNNPVQIIHLFNGDCGFCKGSLKKWEDYIENFIFKENTDFIFLVYTSNEEFLRDDFLTKISFKQPVYLIDKDVFFRQNELPDQNISSLTFLLIDNTIKGIGNPIYDNECKYFFVEVVLSYLDG